jgi:chitodextrinase
MPMKVWSTNRCKTGSASKWRRAVWVVAAFAALGMLESQGNAAPGKRRGAGTVLRDSTPPTQPEVAVTGVGPTHVSLAWSSIDDGPYLWYTVYQDGVPIYPLIGADSATAYLLVPGATYTFTVRALDFGGNFSPLSAPVTVTTPGLGSPDTVPPTAPSNLISDVFDNEISLRWSASSDNHDAPTLISYEISLNGELVDVAVAGRTQTIVYGVNGSNLVSIVAVDSSGNRSAAISAVIPVAF